MTTGPASPDYQLETVLGYVLKYMDVNTIPLYECLHGATDHFVSRDSGTLAATGDALLLSEQPSTTSS